MMLRLDERIAGRRLWRYAPDRERLMFVPDAIRKCVCFLSYDAKDGRKLAGTAFFFGVPVGAFPERVSIYLVTAKHVIKGIEHRSVDKSVFIRINTDNQSSDWIETKCNQWLFDQADPFVDVAVLSCSFPFKSFDVRMLSSNMLATKHNLEREGIGLGDEVVVPGLFYKHHGRQRNIPIIRIGNIAAMPEEGVRVKMWGNHVDIDAYLIESRSIGGLSGSPVFVHGGQVRGVNGELKYRANPKFYLLGLVHGHWDEDFSVEDLKSLKDKDVESFNMGLSVVVPFDKIAGVINHPDLVKEREKDEQDLLDMAAPTPDEMPDALIETPRQSDAMTRTDFEEALKQVSRRVAEPDEGTS